MPKNLSSTELVEKIEELERETTISMAVRDPKQYKLNNKVIERLRKQLLKKTSLKL